MNKPQSAAGAAAERYSPERPYKPLVSPPSVEDKDACAIYASVRRDGTPSHESIELAIPALQKMLHRAGNVDGEGDGCGVLLDIPRKIWAEEVRAGGHDPSLTLSDAFAVAHVFVERSQNREKIQHDARELLAQGGFRVLAEREGMVNSPALGPTAREEEPIFWQVAGLVPDAKTRDAVLFGLMIELEQQLDVHVPSFSATTCVYKVMGAPSVLGEYYPDLRDERFETIGCFGHNRYSTNTWPSFKRVQPFSALGHNGEINTIEQLRQEARMLAVPIHSDGSDSQDLNRTIDTLVSREGLSLAEAMEMVVPPIVAEIETLPAELRGFYMYLRQAMGPFAQGPVALISRHADECVFSADAMGLRPLWQVETEDDYVFSSEPGVVPVGKMVAEPKPLAPGEKVLVQIDRAERRASLHPHDEMLRIVREKWLRRNGVEAVAGYERALETGGPLEGQDVPGYNDAGPEEPVKVPDRVLAGFGWQRDDVKLVQQMASNGAEPVGSLGYDGPLAALSPERQNLADYFKETVAVVTNPALDRERELEHFSTRTLFGRRPSLDAADEDTGTVEASFPVILGGHHGLAPLSDKTYRRIAREHRTYLLEDLWEEFRGRASAVDISLLESETTAGAIERIKQEAVKKVRDGAELLILTDRTVYDADRRYLDPHLATSAVDQALKQFKVERGEENLRRRCGVVLRSAAIRNVHDVMLALGLGANGVCPYTMVEVICVEEYESDVSNLCAALRKGIEKVISTIGIHEVRGYARQFSSIGIKPELAEIFQCEAFASSAKGGTGFAELDEDTNARARALSGDDEAAKPAKTFRFYPKVYKAAIATANGSGSYEDYSEKVRELEKQNPISMRHIMGLRGDRDPVDPSGVDAGVGHHDYPIVISSMSFGSQSEPAFRAYAEAAKAINILCVNGEGGEIRDMYGRYRKWRGQQVASGRFGVSAEMINSSYVAEIKIGQGAKPGEGGHLPGKKVSEKVAAARNAAPGTDLISPSNNHDLYSIEDLAELVDELKTVNPDVRVSVKVPVVPNIGTIGLGIAKAGADIITLSGFEGGTGAARQHALRHVGLPSDIGTRAVHRALMEAGLRNRVEIWADGGYRTGHDVVKLHCLGANRVGFGTLAMVSLGCTICRGCQLDTCHVGIATQIETVEQAQQHGLKKFTPQEVDRAAESCARFFAAMGEEVKQVVASLGYERAQELVGRYDLLEQVAYRDRIDLAPLITPLEEFLDLEPIDLPVAEELEEVRAEAGLVVARPIRMEEKQASHQIAALAPEVCSGQTLRNEFPRATDASDRVLGTELAGAIARSRIFEDGPEPSDEVLASLEFNGGSVAGQGLGAFNSYGVAIRIEGGAQDGVGKAMLGGTIAILKGKGARGKRLNGSVGKSFAYGAQRGRLFVQGSADSRFCIRLSGADVVLAGEPERPIDDSRGCLVDRANAKGFAFEYMTSGRAIVLGDIGPWACAGMTGGRVYVRHNAFGIDRAAIERRLGEGAKVELKDLDAEGLLDIDDLLSAYAEELKATGQSEEAVRILEMAADATSNFMMIIPQRVQADPSISTE
ncbi:MAG TPA: glutamate synthase-related protein [Solirubrobacterales bacterium]|jgi:glutamate synthase (NADPH/NADH) large chain|nr:glutamate synthase-related protein [Solirubrobacterales bacterium]